MEYFRLALKTLGKHHGISYAMIQENGGDDKFFERFTNLDHDAMAQPTMANMMCASFENSITTNITIVEVCIFSYNQFHDDIITISHFY